MCGRFTQKLTWHQIHDLYNLTAPTVPLNLQPRYNGAPGQEFAACRLDGDGNRTMVQLRWGLVPSWARDVRGIRLINARTETIHTKPSFSAAFRSRRCLVPADGWCSSGNGPGTASSLTSWRLRADCRFRLPLCGSTGARATTPSNPSPSSRRRPLQSLPTFTIDSPPSSLQTVSTTGSTQRRRCQDYSTWCVNPMAALMRSVPLAPE